MSLDNRSLLLTCWLCRPGIPGRDICLFIGTNSQVGHFTGAGVSLDNRSLLLTCWLCCPWIPGRDTRLFIGTVFIMRGQCGRYVATTLATRTVNSGKRGPIIKRVALPGFPEQPSQQI